MTKFELLVIRYLRWITLLIMMVIVNATTEDFNRGLWTVLTLIAVFFLPTGETK